MPKKKDLAASEKPAFVLDAAAYISERQPKKDPITAWKLQKLVYFCKACVPFSEDCYLRWHAQEGELADIGNF